jgi:hypothetical protein
MANHEVIVDPEMECTRCGNNRFVRRGNAGFVAKIFNKIEFKDVLIISISSVAAVLLQGTQQLTFELVLRSIVTTGAVFVIIFIAAFIIEIILSIING